MKEKTLQSFSSVNLGRTLFAIHTYKKELKCFSKQLFEVMATKVFNKGKDVELDGMEMHMMIEALNQHSILLKAEGNTKEAKIYIQLAEQVKQIRINFQRKNGPKIEKTASAPTLTAMAYKAV